MRKGIGVIAALAALGMATGASAQTVILACSISSSNIEELPAGGTLLYKIGGEQWQEWSAEQAQWGTDRCKWFGHVSNPSCRFAPAQFGLQGSNTLGVYSTMTIDRRTGDLSASISLPGNNGVETASGTCRPAVEPAAPKTQF